MFQCQASGKHFFQLSQSQPTAPATLPFLARYSWLWHCWEGVAWHLQLPQAPCSTCLAWPWRWATALQYVCSAVEKPVLLSHTLTSFALMHPVWGGLRLNLSALSVRQALALCKSPLARESVRCWRSYRREQICCKVWNHEPAAPARGGGGSSRLPVLHPPRKH